MLIINITALFSACNTACFRAALSEHIVKWGFCIFSYWWSSYCLLLCLIFLILFILLFHFILVFHLWHRKMKNNGFGLQRVVSAREFGFTPFGFCIQLVIKSSPTATLHLAVFLLIFLLVLHVSSQFIPIFRICVCKSGLNTLTAHHMMTWVLERAVDIVGRFTIWGMFYQS